MKNNAAELFFRKKQERRRQLVRLPFEKKIEIVVELQKAAALYYRSVKTRILGFPASGFSSSSTSA